MAKKPPVSRDIDDLREELELDVKIRADILDAVCADISVLHAKWIGYLADVRREYMISKQRFKQIDFDLTMYYLGKSNADAYRIRPLHHKIIKSEVDMWLAVDPVWKAADLELKELDTKLEFCIEAIKACVNKTWQCRTILEFTKFSQGVSGGG